jgi:hypothetical protein
VAGDVDGGGNVLYKSALSHRANHNGTYIVIVSVVTRSVICEVDEFVAMVVTKLLVMVVDITGSGMEADGAVVEGEDDLGGC